VDTYSLNAQEALNIRGIVRTRLAKSTHDAGWASFFNILAYKAEGTGVRVVAVNPRNTTQACSACGVLPEIKKMLSDRVHSCSCGYVVDRDVNAALNIIALGRRVQYVTQRVVASVTTLSQSRSSRPSNARVHRRRLPTREAARSANLRVSGGFCNRRRLHSALGHVSLEDFEGLGTKEATVA